MITALSNLNIVTWIPEPLHPILLAVKALLAVASVIMLITHMQLEWSRMRSYAQRLRYLCLLAYAVLVAGASAEQISEGMLLSYRHLGAIIVTGFLCYVSYVSMHEAHHSRHHS